jgi:FkbM family methyltransferase
VLHSFLAIEPPRAITYSTYQQGPTTENLIAKVVRFQENYANFFSQSRGDFAKALFLPGLLEALLERILDSPRLWLTNLRRLTEILACWRETGQWLPVTLDYLGLRPVAYPYDLRLRGGERVVLREHVDVVVFWMVFARQHYPVAASLGVILDIGANIGMFTLYAARKAPGARIIAIEPFPDTCERLKQLVEANHLRDRVTILNCAVTGTAGERTMDSAEGIPSQYRRIYSPETATLNTSHRGPAGAKQDDNGVPVQAETLARVLDLAGLPVVDMVKMNIHGNEYDVLLGSDPDVLKRCRRIAVQYHEMPAAMCLGKKQIVEHLSQLGFSLIADDDTHRGSGLALFAACR